MDKAEVLVMAAASEAFGFEGGLQTVNSSDLLRFADLLKESWNDSAQLPASAPSVSVDEALLAAAKLVLSNKRGEDDWLILSIHCVELEKAIQRAEASKAEKIPGEVERVTMERFIVVLGVPAHDDATHDCDAMGCGRAHVLARIPRV